MAKITEEELLQVQELRKSLNDIIASFGELHLNKLLLTNDLKKIEDEQRKQEVKFEEFQQKEMVLYEELQKKYGTGTIDIETGEIT